MCGWFILRTQRRGLLQSGWEGWPYLLLSADAELRALQGLSPVLATRLQETENTEEGAGWHFCDNLLQGVASSFLQNSLASDAGLSLRF